MAQVAILGAGESGTGAALLAHAKGHKVFVSDAGPIAPHYKATLADRGIAIEEGGHTASTILQANEVVKSPGIPNEAPIVEAIRRANIPIIDEIELASRYTQATIIGITGTNGKTTTAKLTHHLLHTAQLDVGLAGNIGQSFARSVLEDPKQYYVLELSSFQLEHIHTFHPHIACLTGITPDHLDRYQGQMQRYANAKFKMLTNMTPQDHFIYNHDNNTIQDQLPLHPTQATKHPLSIATTTTTAHTLLAQGAFPLPGPHNAMNALAAITIAQLLGISGATIQHGLSTVLPIAHRLEKVANIDGILFYNDSKATNTEAAEVALTSFEQPIIWIAGGRDKGNDYTRLRGIAQQRVKALVCLGQDTTAIREAFKDTIDTIVTTGDMPTAVAAARTLAHQGDVVLLSPACASFDLFRNFEDRGQQFKKTVLQQDQPASTRSTPRPC